MAAIKGIVTRFIMALLNLINSRVKSEPLTFRSGDFGYSYGFEASEDESMIIFLSSGVDMVISSPVVQEDPVPR